MSSDLINTLEAPGEFDALSTLRPGEPYFLLVGRDRLAPPLIRDWADKNRRRAIADFDAGLITAEKKERELRKSTQAEMIAEAMVEHKNHRVAVRASEAKPVTYSGHELPKETKLRDALQSARARAASAISGAVAALSDLIEADRPFGAVGADLDDEADALRALSDVIMPARPLPGSAPLLERAHG